MFTSIDLFPSYSREESKRLTDRWNSPDISGYEYKKVIEIIKNGAGPGCFEKAFEPGNVNFSPNDLRGIYISGETFGFKMNDGKTKLEELIETFLNTDFSYSTLESITFENVFFANCKFHFANIDNCKFLNCIFLNNEFFAAELSGTTFKNCDFLEKHRFHNCDLTNCKFENIFLTYRLFYNSSFDENTSFENIKERIINTPQTNIHLDKARYAEIYKGLKEGYRNGDCGEQQRNYYQQEMKAKTRYNSKGILDKALGYFLEVSSGYGVRPIIVLRNIFFVFVIFSVVYIYEFNFFDGLILSSGAFLTFGAQTDLLKNHKVLEIIYIIEAFFGMSMIAFFITVLYNYWFNHK